MSGRPSFSATSLCLTVALAAAPAPLTPQEAVDLTGDELNPVRTMDSEIGSLVSGIFGGNPDGELERVVVRRDRSPELEVEVTYSGFEEAFLSGEVMREHEGSRTSIREIELIDGPVRLDGSGTATLRFRVADDAARDFAVHSDFLELLVAKSARRSTGLEATYLLPKRWTADLAPEEVVVDVFATAMQPVGATYKMPPPVRSSAHTFADPTERAVAVDTIRLRNRFGRYLAARGGGGGDLLLVEDADHAGTVFERIWEERERSDGTARLRTADGWHYVALRSSGDADASALDPDDPSTRLRFLYQGDGGWLIAGATVLARTPEMGVDPRTGRRTRITGYAESRAFLQAAHTPVGSKVIRYREGRRFPDFSILLRGQRSRMPVAAGEPSRRQGPSSTTSLQLDGGLVMPGFRSGGGPDFADLLNIQPVVYGDANPASGVFYYVPAAYRLRWDPDEGGGFQRIFFAGTEDGEAGQVAVDVTLHTGVGYAERQAVELLTYQAARSRGLPFSELRPLPVRDLRDSLAHHLQVMHDIPATQVDVTTPSNLQDPIRVSWRMDQREMNNLAERLRSAQGIHSVLVVTPESEALGSRYVELRISLDDPETYGRIQWEDAGRWRNLRPHPVRLRHLYALVLDREGTPTLLSWDLSGTATVPPRAETVHPAAFTQRVREAAFYTRVDHLIDRTESSTELAIRALTGSVSEPERRTLTFYTLNPLSATGAHEVRVRIRSAYLDPSGRESETRSLRLDADGASASLPLYAGSSAGDVPFEYTLDLVMPDGRTHQGTNWIPGDPLLEVNIGTFQLEQALGELPTEAGAPSATGGDEPPS